MRKPDAPPPRIARLYTDSTAIVLLCLLSLAIYRQTALTNLILPGVDAFTYFYPYRAYAAATIRSGHLPLWNPYLFMGVPFLGNPQAAVLYPFNLALCFLPAPRMVIWSAVIHVALAATFAYLYARRVLKLGPAAAFLGGGTFAWGGFICGQVEHINQLNVYAWFPLLLLLWERRRTGPAAIAGLGAAIGVGLLAGHAQASYITLFGLAIYALTSTLCRLDIADAQHRRRSRVGSPAPTPQPGNEAQTERDPDKARTQRRTAARETPTLTAHLWEMTRSLSLALIIALGLAAMQLLPTLELARFSVRSGGLSYREAVAFSLKPSPRLLRYTFLPPWGKDLATIFGGDFFTEYLAYVGIIPLLLAVVGTCAIMSAATGRSATTCPARNTRAMLAMLALSLSGILLALGLYNPLYFVLYKLVPGLALFRAPVRWLFLYAFGAAMLAAIGLQRLNETTRSRQTFRHLIPLTLTLISITELFAAARHLPLHHPTAPEAFSSLRTAPAHILAAQQRQVIPGRFLSMSDIRFDPGDLAEIELIFKDQLPERAIYDYVVCAKRKEILAPNLALARRIYGVDGYDGGVLPPARYVYLQRLLLDEKDILPDGRLRERLKQIPSSRILSILGVRYLITDKVNDVWIDDVFYDLAFDATLTTTPGFPAAVTASDLPHFAATALGVVSYLEGGEGVRPDTPVAEVYLTLDDGTEHTFTLRAGQDTAEGTYREGIAHPIARIGHRSGEVNEYVTRLRWGQARYITHLKVVALPFGGQFHLRGMALVDERDGSNLPLILSTQGRYRQVHSGDVKVYEVLDALPRAYPVHRTHIVTDDQAALTLLASPDFDPSQEIVLAAGRQLNGTTHPKDVVIPLLYRPEQVTLQVTLREPGYLVLSDTWYPGWHATVDGHPAHIERANLNFRAVYVEEGSHIVRFYYRPTSYTIGLAISAIASLLTWAFARRWLPPCAT